MPRNFFPQNQKIIPEQQKIVIRAIFTRIGALKPDCAAHGVRNLL